MRGCDERERVCVWVMREGEFLGVRCDERKDDERWSDLMGVCVCDEIKNGEAVSSSHHTWD